MNLTPDSPELTAYVPGELPPHQRAEVDAALQASPALAAEVEALRQTAHDLASALTMPEAVPALDPARRSEILAAAERRVASPALAAATHPAPDRKVLPDGPGWMERLHASAAQWLRTWWPVAGAMAASAAVAVWITTRDGRDATTVAFQDLRYQRLPVTPANAAARKAVTNPPPATPALADSKKSALAADKGSAALDSLSLAAPPPAPVRPREPYQSEARVNRKLDIAKAKPSSEAPAPPPASVSEPRLAHRYGIRPAVAPSSTAAPTPAPLPSPSPTGARGALALRPTEASKSAAGGQSFSGGLAMAPSQPAAADALGRAERGERREQSLVRGEFLGYDRAPVDPTGEGYAAIIENEFRPVVAAPLSTFGLDVDTASYANVRRFLREGTLPPRDAVRVEEMINYFRYPYPEPRSEHPVSVSVEVAESPWREGCKLVRVGIQARSVERATRPPANLVFLVDVSGSMAPENKLPLVKRSLRLLLDRLGPRDRVALVTYAAGSQVLADPTPVDAAGKAALTRVIDRLQAGNGTHGSAGIQAAYALAARNLNPENINRVLLCTDGDFNIGATRHDELLDLITEQARTGVFLTVLGYGMGNYQDATMELLADKGNGQYAYIDSFQEARKVLGEELESTLVTVAKDVKAQVEFNPARARSYRLVGYENRALRDRDFADDTKDGGELGAGHQVTVLYEVEPVAGSVARAGPLRYQAAPGEEEAVRRRLKRGHEDELLVVKLRYKQPDGTTSRLLEVPVKDGDLALAEASLDTQFAAAVASQAMLLRGSAHLGTMRWEDVLRLAERGVGPDREGYRSEFVDLVRRAAQLAPQRPGRPGAR
ncbi:MAG: von Willebrand factor type A domain-containing protein [Verrucomicrobiota bacterium]